MDDRSRTNDSQSYRKRHEDYDRPNDRQEKRHKLTSSHDNRSRSSSVTTTTTTRSDQEKEITKRDITDIDWKDHKEFLESLFFKKTDLISKFSAEYEDFWDFFDKYILFRKNKLKSKSNQNFQVDEAKAKELGLPTTFDDRYLINFSIMTDKSASVRDRSTDRLSSEELSEFRKVIHLYENFLQKKKYNRLVKLKQDKLSLPIAKFRDDILQTVAASNVVLVAGDTGCGKSTQTVQYLLDAHYNRIACTQPRRIATMSLAKRVAFETLNEYGSKIAYQIRFESSKGAETRVLFLTEGLLLRQVASDPLLKRYDVIVLDEVHERHIFSDFLMGILKKVLTKRTDMKLILMSATINIQLFSDYFNKSPIIMVPGRLYPIEVEYHPIEDNRADLAKIKEQFDDKKKRESYKKRIDPRPFLRILERIDQQFPADERGDLLIFMSGMDEILTLADEVKKYASQAKTWVVLLLHSSLSVEEQDKVFDVAADGIRKCIISTNIAETSVTIDGIRFVIDSGKVKEIGYDSEAKMQRLQEFWISKASAEQRKGRAGRTGPGMCFRLYSREEYEEFADYPVPEIKRIPLQSVILQIKALDLGDPRQFDFIESPAMENIEEAILHLKKHEAMEDSPSESLTPLGNVLAKLPVDVTNGKILVLATIFDILEPVLTICAALSVQSPFLRTTADETINARNVFITDHGDPFTLLNLYNEWINIKSTGRENTKKWCRRHGVEEHRLYDILKLRQQFKELLQDCKLIEGGKNQEEDTNVFGEKLSNRSILYKKRELKTMQQEREKQRSRKILHLEDFQNNQEEEEEKLEELDLRDIDFKLSYSLQDLQKSIQSLSRQDVNLIKVILCSGLYPNLAVPDEYNANHKESDQVYHSQFKQFASLHPTSTFSGRSMLLQNTDILCYDKLLETNKPYITSCFRTPAFQTMMLCAGCIDLNRDCSRIIIDNWVEFKLANPKLGEKIILIVHQLRLIWKNMLSKKLSPPDISATPSYLHMKQTVDNIQQQQHQYVLEDPSWPPMVAKILKENSQSSMICNESELAEKLAQFLEWPVSYTMKRLKSSDLLSVFHIEQDKKESDNLNPMEQLEVTNKTKSTSFEERKGGIKLNSYMRYASIREENEIPSTAGYTKYLKKPYKCEKCGGQFIFNIDEIELHTASCGFQPNPPDQDRDQIVGPPRPASSAEASVSGARTRFYCEKCDKNFLFTPVEILRHNSSHK